MVEYGREGLETMDRLGDQQHAEMFSREFREFREPDGPDLNPIATILLGQRAERGSNAESTRQTLLTAVNTFIGKHEQVLLGILDSIARRMGCDPNSVRCARDHLAALHRVARNMPLDKMSRVYMDGHANVGNYMSYYLGVIVEGYTKIIGAKAATSLIAMANDYRAVHGAWIAVENTKDGAEV